MADDRDGEELQLNTLHRFAKHSPRLLLEEYSHCEVPAGCGGAILRWRDPADGIPLKLVVAAAGDLSVLVDGRYVSEQFALKPGRHLIAVAVTGARIPALALAINRAGPGTVIHPGHPIWATSARTRVTRRHWEGWAQLAYDDTGWSTPGRASVDLGSREWRYRQVENLGARIIPTLGPDLWLRDWFEVAE